MNNTWFTADTHFGHKNIIDHCNRPVNNVFEMNELIVDNWNAVVGQNDEVWHLGDVAWKDIEVYLPRLNGRINVVLGNHDKQKNVIARNITGEVFQLKEIKVGTKDITLCHYPMVTWNKARYGAWHLHGHMHGMMEGERKGRMDVGIDCHPEFRPFNYDEIDL
jgi:calcineurin-like phosphoesterase family protein